MRAQRERLLVLIFAVTVCVLPKAVSAQVRGRQLFSSCQNNNCTVYIGADTPPPRDGHFHQPGPATGSTDFTPDGQDWTFTLQTGDPLTGVYSDQAYWYTATFGEGGSIQITAPSGTFSGVITSGTAEGGYGPFPIYHVNVNFQGQWSNGIHSRGSVDLSYQDDIAPEFDSTLTIVPD